MTKSQLIGVVCGVFALLAGGCTAQSRVGVLRVCLGDSDLPRAQRKPLAGFDVDVARLLAEGLNREFEPVWLTRANPTEIESSDIDFRALLQGQCDLQLSIPGAAAIKGLAERLALTQPYYGAAFELVPATANIDLANGRGGRIAVRANTVAHSLIDQLGFAWTMRRDSLGITAAIAEGEADAGLIWGPDLAALNISHNADFETPVALRWNHHAVTRSADIALIAAIDVVLLQSGTRRAIEASMRRHGIPPHQPFASVHRGIELNQ